MLYYFFHRICCHTAAILFGFNEEKMKKLINLKITETENREFDSRFAKHSTLKNLQLSPHSINQYPLVVSSERDEVVSIAGIYLPVISNSSNINVSLVEVSSTLNNLRKIALGLVSNRAICLLGAVGSGKTSLVEYLAEKTGRNLGENFIKVQLGDQTDSKMLLGTYKCTDIPGEFVWQPGVLTQVTLYSNTLITEILTLVQFNLNENPFYYSQIVI